jgi:hypothetical protein
MLLAAAVGSGIGAGIAAEQAASEHAIGGPWHLAALNGHSQATIWLVDRTDTTWPVTAAADEWNRSRFVTIGRRAECPHAGDYCPPVHQVNNNNFFGQTTYKLNNARTHISREGFEIRLSNATPLGARRSVACHEEGHALGLDHRKPSNSCMVDGAVFPARPDDHDFNALQNIYSHND